MQLFVLALVFLQSAGVHLPSADKSLQCIMILDLLFDILNCTSDKVPSER